MPRTARVAPGRVLFHVLVERAEDWRWSSLWRWRHPEVTEEVPPLTAWPLERPRQLIRRYWNEHFGV